MTTGPTFASLANANAPSGSNTSTTAASTAPVASANPNPTATADRLRPEGVENQSDVKSDAEVSATTSSRLNDPSRLNIVLQYPSAVGSVFDAKIRRLLYGNAHKPSPMRK